MSIPGVVIHGGVTLDLETIKSFKLDSSIDSGKTNIMVIEHITRCDFIQHPETKEYIKQEFNEVTEVNYRNYDIAAAHRDEWA